ncbi:MAG: hypothetical protein HYY24_13550 [Verrucomicrobia bacterium]|nr:hypothetical protein [Verrucomicrobiota bacterium]
MAHARDLAFHQVCSVELIAAGEQLALLAALNGLPDNSEGISLAALEAELESLYDTLAGWHGGLTPARKEQILQEVFGVPQSEA